MLERLREALRVSFPRHLDDLRQLVRIPSVSAKGEGLEDAAACVASLLSDRGLDVRVHEGDGAPVVTASGGAAEGPTLLCYEHYDVQPPEPLEEWTVPPFDLTERDGCLYGRGSADTKGHIVCRLAAVDAMREVGADPVRWLFVVEGEEEIGSPNLPAFLEAHRDDLRADGCVWESGGVDESGRPIIYAGMKGIAGLEFVCRTANRDLHSSYGAVIDNPIWRLASAIASLRDADGRVCVDGFYDDVDPPTDAELEAVRTHPDRTAEMSSMYGVDRFLGGATGAELERRLELEPCVNVNGLHAGYGGPGGKTVLPSVARAKLDIRLVPSQRPERVIELVRSHLDRAGFADVELIAHPSEPAARTPLDDRFVQLVVRTARLAYGVDPVVQPSVGGSGPVHAFRHHLGVPFASAGCGYPGSRIHAPDEHIRIEDFDRARLHSALIAAALGGLV